MLGEVEAHLDDIRRQLLPYAFDIGYHGLSTKLTPSSDFKWDTSDFCSQTFQPDHHSIDGILEFQNFATSIDFGLPTKATASDGFDDFSNGADLGSEDGGEVIDSCREFAPCAFKINDDSLTIENALGTDLIRDANDIRSEFGEMVDPSIDDILGLNTAGLAMTLICQLRQTRRTSSRGCAVEASGVSSLLL